MELHGLPMAKETYPLPGQKEKKPPSIRRKVVEQVKANLKPADCYLLNLSDWEEAVFRDATYFTVCRSVRPAGEMPRTLRLEFPTFPDAVTEANGDPKAMVYAVTAQDHFFCVPPKEWDKYLVIWGERA